MKKIILCLLIAYLLGSISPAAIIAKCKKIDLRDGGTKNLGATNTTLLIGRTWGAFVMLFDIAKGFMAVRIAQWILPTMLSVSLASGFFAVLGHCFPFYMKFKGGKGLAAFGGAVLAYNPLLFLFLLITGVVLMLLVNYSYIMPFYGAIGFALHVAIHTDQALPIFIALLLSLLVFGKHFGNFKKARRGEDFTVRDFIRQKLFHKN